MKKCPLIRWRVYVDFVCLERRIVVEVDGGQHQKGKG
ncbi:MAG: DUF559 domain-containing protein [Actinomycetota bacterium]|nr:DUF559 domain-containing protein [Actinomycetota bacterium]